MEIITAYKANDGMIFATKEECLEHNLYLIDWDSFKGVCYIHSTFDDKAHKYNITLTPFTRPTPDNTIRNKLTLSDSYLYIPNDKLATALNHLADYFYPMDRFILKGVKTGINYVYDDGDYWSIGNIKNDIEEYKEDLERITTKLNIHTEFQNSVMNYILSEELKETKNEL